VRKSTDVARTLGAGYVKLWPGQDGFDYPFQADYRQLWDLSVTGVRAVATADPSMRFAIEYKAKEPRTHMFFSSAERTLLCIEDMGVDNVGIVMDLGHSLYGRETPAEAVQIIAQRGKLYGVDLNDNWREWDDDLTVGSVHVIETLEFIDALLSMEWKGLWQLDQFPFREDPIEAARLSISTIRGMIRLLQRVNMDDLRTAQQRQDALAAQRVIQAALLGEGVLQ
jgi:xylose isomerase